MATNIFVNLPVKDLTRSIAFFTHLGYRFNQQYSDQTATCMVVAENIFVMLLTEEKFKSFTPKPICDAHMATEALICLQVETRAQVAALVARALEAGGSTYKEPQDHGFMYGHGYQDLDGHMWEVLCMDASAMPRQQ